MGVTFPSVGCLLLTGMDKQWSFACYFTLENHNVMMLKTMTSVARKFNPVMGVPCRRVGHLLLSAVDKQWRSAYNFTIETLNVVIL